MHFNRLDATERVVDSDDKILDLDLIPTESSDTLYTDSDTAKKDRIREKEIYQEKENLRLQKIADITDIDARIQFAATLQNQDTSGGDNPALSTITGDVDGKYNPFKILDKDINLAQEYYKNAAAVEARNKTAKIETNYLDHGGLSNYFSSEAEKRIYLNEISNIISMASNSINKYSEDGTRFGFLQVTPKQWKAWVENHVGVERDLYGVVIPETWTLENDPTAILGQSKHAAVLSNYILFSPDVDSDLRARIIKGDINASEEFVNKHIFNGQENFAADVKQAILKNEYVGTSGDLAFINPKSLVGKTTKVVPGGEQLVNFLGGYGQENIISNGFDNSTNGILALFNSYKLRNEIPDMETILKSVKQNAGEPSTFKMIGRILKDVMFEKGFTTDTEKQQRLLDIMNYNNMRGAKQFSRDMVTYMNELPYYAVGEATKSINYGSKLLRSAIGSGTAFYLPSVMKSSLIAAIQDNKVNDFKNFTEHLFSSEVQIEGGKAFTTGFLLRGIGDKYIMKPMRIDVANPFTKRTQSLSTSHARYNRAQPNYDPLNNPVQNTIANVAWDTVGLGTLAPTIQEGRLPEASDYLHSGAFAAALRINAATLRALKGAKKVRKKMRDNSSTIDPKKVIYDVEGVEVPTKQSKNIKLGIMPEVYDRHDIAVRKAFEKHNAIVTNPPKFRQNETVELKNGKETVQVKEVINQNGIDVAIVKNKDNVLEPVLQKDLGKHYPNIQGLHLDKTDEIIPLTTTPNMTNLHLETAQRYKEIIDDYLIDDFEITTENVSAVQANINGMYYSKPRKPILTRKSSIARRNNILNEASFNRIFINNDSEIEILSRYLPRTKKRVYNKEFLDDYIMPADRDYTEIDRADFFTLVEGRDFKITPLLKFNPLGDKRNPFIAVEVESNIESETPDIYVFNKAAYDMLNLQDGVELTRPTVSFVYDRAFNPANGEGSANPEYTKRPKEEHGALFFVKSYFGDSVKDIQLDGGQLVGAIKPLKLPAHVYRGLEKMARVERQKEEIPVVKSTEDFTVTNDFLNPINFAPKSGTEIRDRLFYGTGMTMADMLIILRRIGVEVEFLTPNQMRTKYGVTGALGFTGPPELFNKKAAPGTLKQSQMKLVVDKKLKGSANLRIALEQTFAHEFMHVIDFYDRNFDKYIPLKDRDTTEEYMKLFNDLGFDKGYLAGFESEDGKTSARTPGNFNFEELNKFLASKGKKAKTKDFAKLGRGNVLGALGTFKNFGEEFFDMNNNTPMSRVAFITRKQELERAAGKKAEVAKEQEKYKALFETDVAPKDITTEKNIMDVLKQFTAMSLYDDFMNFKKPLQLQFIRRAIELMPKNAREIFFNPQTFSPADYKEYGRAFARAFEKVFLNEGMLSMHVVHREMSEISQRFRPLDDTYLDPRHPFYSQYMTNRGRTFFDSEFKVTNEDGIDIPAVTLLKQELAKEGYVLPNTKRILEMTPNEYTEMINTVKSFLSGKNTRQRDKLVRPLIALHRRMFNYFNNTKELFADWGMAFVLYPEYVKVHAPTTTSFFLQHLEKKPEFAKVYLDIQAALNKTPGSGEGREEQLFDSIVDEISLKQDEVRKTRTEMDDIADPFVIKGAAYEQHAMLTSFLDIGGGKPTELATAILEEKKMPNLKTKDELDVTNDPDLTMAKDVKWHLLQNQLKATDFELIGNKLEPYIAKMFELKHKYGIQDMESFFTTVALLNTMVKGGSREDILENPFFLASKEHFKNQKIQPRDVTGKKVGEPVDVTDLLSKKPMAEDMLKFIDKKYPEMNQLFDDIAETGKEILLGALNTSGLVDLNTLKKIKNKKYFAFAYADREIERIERTGMPGFKGSGFEKMSGSYKTPMASVEIYFAKLFYIANAAGRNKLLNVLFRTEPYDATGINKMLRDNGLMVEKNQLYPIATELWQGQRGYVWEHKELFEKFFPGIMGSTIGAKGFKLETLPDGTKTLAFNNNLKDRVIRPVTKEDMSVPTKIRNQAQELRIKAKRLSNVFSSEYNPDLAAELREQAFYLELENSFVNPARIPKHMKLIEFTMMTNERLEDVTSLMTGEKIEGMDLEIVSGKTSIVRVFVHQSLANAFTNDDAPITNSNFLKWWLGWQQLFKEIYVGYNPIYAARNPARDIFDIAVESGVNLTNLLDKNAYNNVKNILARFTDKDIEKVDKQTQALAYAKYVIEALPDTYRAVRGKKIQDAENEEFFKRINMLPLRGEVGASYNIFRDETQRNDMDALLDRLSIKDKVNYHRTPEKAFANHVLPHAQQLLYEIYSLTKAGEVAPRAAWWRYYRDGQKAGRFPDVDPKLLDLEVGTILTPNYAARGGSTAKYLEAFMPFFNATVQSYRKSARAFQRNPEGYLARTLSYHKWDIIVAMALAGMFGSAIRTLFMGITPEDSVLSHPLPLFIQTGDADDGSLNRLWYMTVPRSGNSMAVNFFIRSTVNKLGHEAGFDGMGSAYDDRQDRAAQNYLSFNESVLYHSIVDITNFLVHGQMPKSNLTGQYLVDDATATLSEASEYNLNFFGPLGDNMSRFRFFDDFAKSFSNKYGLLSPLGFEFDLNRDKRYETFNDKLKDTPGGALLAPFIKQGPQFGEIPINQYKHDKKIHMAREEENITGYFKSVNNGKTPTQDQVEALYDKIKRNGIDGFAEFCRQKGMNCSRLSLQYLSLSQKERDYMEKYYYNRFINGQTGTMVDEDKDAYDAVREKLYQQQLKEAQKKALGEDIEEQQE